MFFKKKEPAPEPPEKQGWFARLTAGLSRTRQSFTEGIRSLFADKEKEREEGPVTGTRSRARVALL